MRKKREKEISRKEEGWRGGRCVGGWKMKRGKKRKAIGRKGEEEGRKGGR